VYTVAITATFFWGESMRLTSAILLVFCVAFHSDAATTVDDQLLGYWNDTTNYGGRNPLNGESVHNRDFRNYSNNLGFGKDFRIYSDVKITELPLPPEPIFLLK
jgi:hypothetical protein